MEHNDHVAVHWREQLAETPTQALDLILIEASGWFGYLVALDADFIRLDRAGKIDAIMKADRLPKPSRIGGLFDFLHKMRRVRHIGPARAGIAMAAE